MTNNSQSSRDLSMCYLSKLISQYLLQLTVSILSLPLLKPNTFLHWGPLHYCLCSVAINLNY